MLPATTSPSQTVAELRTGSLDPATVYRTWAPTVGRWAHQLAGPGADTEDVVHEVFLKVYEGLPRFRGESQLSTWIFRITHNEVSRRRRRARFVRWFSRDAGEQAQDLPASGRSALESIEAEQEVRWLYRCLDQLKERDRTVLILFEIEGLPGEQIAEMMGARVGTVWTWLHRARARLQAALLASGQGAG